MVATASETRSRLVRRVARYIQATDDEGAPPYEYAEFAADYRCGCGPFSNYSGRALSNYELGNIWYDAERAWEDGI